MTRDAGPRGRTTRSQNQARAMRAAAQERAGIPRQAAGPPCEGAAPRGARPRTTLHFWVGLVLVVTGTALAQSYLRVPDDAALPFQQSILLTADVPAPAGTDAEPSFTVGHEIYEGYEAFVVVPPEGMTSGALVLSAGAGAGWWCTTGSEASADMSPARMQPLNGELRMPFGRQPGDVRNGPAAPRTGEGGNFTIGSDGIGVACMSWDLRWERRSQGRVVVTPTRIEPSTVAPPDVTWSFSEELQVPRSWTLENGSVQYTSRSITSVSEDEGVVMRYPQGDLAPQEGPQPVLGAEAEIGERVHEFTDTVALRRVELYAWIGALLIGTGAWPFVEGVVRFAHRLVTFRSPGT